MENHKFYDASLGMNYFYKDLIDFQAISMGT